MLVQAILGLIDLPTLVIFLLALVLGLWFTSGKQENLPPGPTPLPIIGNMIQVAGHKKQWLMYMEWRKQYGDVISVKIGVNRMVVVLGWDLIREGLLDNASIMADRPSWLYVINLVFKQKGMFWSNGNTWKDLRKFSVVHLRDFGVGKKSLEERVQDEANILVESFNKNLGEKFYPRSLFCYAVSNIICGIIFGNRFDYDDEKFIELYSYLDFLFKNLGLQVPENFFPFLKYIPTRSPAKPIINNDQKIRSYFHKRIQEHRETFDPDNPRDFLDMYLKLEHEHKNTETLSEENVFRVMVDLFLGGSETTATTMTWVFLYLIRYPHVQKKCHEELDRVVGHGRQVSLSDKGELNYLLATIQEVQRIASTVPFAAPHAATADMKLGGYTIPKGSMVLYHIFSAHHDPKYWNNPEEFRPERWLSPEGKLLKKEAFLPFSVGPRSCIGEPLAKMELILFIATLLQNFTFHTPDGEPKPSLEAIQPGFPLQPLDYNLIAERR